MGDVMCVYVYVCRGHGTLLQPPLTLTASLSGNVFRINKLVSIRSNATRYEGQVGDVVVARVRAVADKRWLLDIGAMQDGVLLLSSVNLPGGIQRRRTHEDAL